MSCVCDFPTAGSAIPTLFLMTMNPTSRNRRNIQKFGCLLFGGISSLDGIRVARLKRTMSAPKGRLTERILPCPIS